jgi:SAM-dependent methyltransferase
VQNPEVKPGVEKANFQATYTQHVNRLLERSASRDVALKRAVGDEFEVMGILQCELLKHYGLKPDGYVIDVGCGSGRTAKPLSDYLVGKYLGTDIVPDLLAFAKELCNRPDWRFEQTSGLSIPEHDTRADMVCFFSVLTHLLHEQSYIYLQEARRVLKPGGRIVFSFLEFAIPRHWDVFLSNVHHVNNATPLNQFISRDAIRAWAEHLDVRIVDIEDGDKPHIPVPHPLHLENGKTIQGMGKLGQSVCVMALP